MSKHIGRFEIVRELGRGAQSIVYLARDPHLQRQVAIKTVHFGHPDASQNRQLLAEARMVSQLRHPSIVPRASFRFSRRPRSGGSSILFSSMCRARILPST